jgi:hypothetical protein
VGILVMLSPRGRVGRAGLRFSFEGEPF